MGLDSNGELGVQASNLGINLSRDWLYVLGAVLKPWFGTLVAAQC